MTCKLCRLGLVVWGFLAGVAPAALAQQAIAPVEGNRSDFRDWQPTQGEVNSREKAAGVAVPEGQQRAADQTLDQLGQQLMQKDQQLRGEVRRLDGPGAYSGTNGTQPAPPP